LKLVTKEVLFGQ